MFQFQAAYLVKGRSNCLDGAWRDMPLPGRDGASSLISSKQPF
jgi:hypothetical protein